MNEKRQKLFTAEDFDKEPAPIVENSVEEPAEALVTETSKSKTWLWILIGIVVLGAVVFFIFSGSGKDEPTAAIEEETEVVENVEANPAVATSETADDDVSEQDAAAETPATSDASVVEAGKTEAAPAAPAPAVAPAAPAVAPQENNAAAVQSASADVSGDVEAESMKVIRGVYGVGRERMEKLGEKYGPIQSRVNELKRKGVF